MKTVVDAYNGVARRGKCRNLDLPVSAARSSRTPALKVSFRHGVLEMLIAKHPGQSVKEEVQEANS